MTAYRPALDAVLAHVADLDTVEVADLTTRTGDARTHAAQGRRALALGGHGEDLAAVDKMLTDARPDLSRPVRVALRWAVLAETYREALTEEQYRALTLAPATADA